MQILFEYSEEDDVDCFGWIKGNVVKFDSTKVRVPQIGWNKLQWKKNDVLLEGLGADEYFYFVNSYYAKPANEQDLLAVADYNGEFCAMIKQTNINVSQCHIEKADLQALNN